MAETTIEAARFLPVLDRSTPVREPDRASSLSVEDFLRDYVMPGRPCIVTDGMRGWSSLPSWSPAQFRRKLGGEIVQVYNDGFDLVGLSTLDEYMDRYFAGPNSVPEVPYVRWYTKLKDVDFLWGDAAFDSFREEWSHPYFLPRTDYLLPFCLEPDSISPVDSLFPARSLFVSGPGAATRLHCDPWSSDAILYQLHGRKRWIMYAPDQKPHLQHADGSYVSLREPDLSRFPTFPQATPSYEVELSSGEAMFVPAGWYHDVETLTGSISLTWNFVHRVSRDRFLSYLESGEPVGHDLDVVRFFFGRFIAPDASAGEIAAYVRRRTA